MRNLGGAIGIATVYTWLGDATRRQGAHINDALGSSGRTAQDYIAATASRLAALTPDPERALSTAQATIGRLVQREALTIAFDEVFRTMAWMFVAALVMVPFCKPPKASAPVMPSANCAYSRSRRSSERAQAQQAYGGGVAGLIDVLDADRELLSVGDRLATVEGDEARAAVSA